MSLILTLRLDPDSQQRFDRLRELHYPSSLNLIAAHITLFHTLPEQDSVFAAVTGAADQRAPFTVAVTGLRSLGKGSPTRSIARSCCGYTASLPARSPSI